MVRIAGKDADALGKSLSTSPTIINETDIAAIEQNCWTAMKNVYDPEIPVNIVDLGLIYACEVTAMAHGEHQVRIKMTLTAPGCGMGPVLQNDVRNALLDLPHIAEVSVEIVLDPPWAREMMSEVAQIQLGLI
jgi:probable FeS assembly SUF system protein SufT